MLERSSDIYSRLVAWEVLCVLAVTIQCACPGYIYAQDSTINFQYITVQNGLPSNTINGVMRDCRGFMWMASENGVCRYDGYGFTTFRAREGDTLSISSNITYVVFEDRKQRSVGRV